jgi:hypothetical protein
MKSTIVVLLLSPSAFIRMKYDFLKGMLSRERNNCVDYLIIKMISNKKFELQNCRSQRNL